MWPASRALGLAGAAYLDRCSRLEGLSGDPVATPARRSGAPTSNAGGAEDLYPAPVVGDNDRVPVNRRDDAGDIWDVGDRSRARLAGRSVRNCARERDWEVRSSAWASFSTIVRAAGLPGLATRMGDTSDVLVPVLLSDMSSAGGRPTDAAIFTFTSAAEALWRRDELRGRSESAGITERVLAKDICGCSTRVSNRCDE